MARVFPTIPEDAIAFVRTAFADANARVTRLLSRQPSMHEAGLDFHLIASLDEIGPRLMPASGAAVEIETHWLGGRRHFGSWEIADFALVVIARRGGVLLARKVALLQSKRLYSREIPVTDLDRSDYEIGIGRLIDRTDPAVPLTIRRKFSFNSTCVYGMLLAGSDQVRRIDSYMRKHNLPVYYTLYNPPKIPYSGMIPRLTTDPEDREINVGCRVLTVQEAHDVLKTLPVGKPPTFAELVARLRKDGSDTYITHGWRLENFVADEVLRCRQGRLFEDTQDQDLATLLYRRDAPIAAAMVITIELPGEAKPHRPGRRIKLK